MDNELIRQARPLDHVNSSVNPMGANAGSDVFNDGLLRRMDAEVGEAVAAA